MAKKILSIVTLVFMLASLLLSCGEHTHSFGEWETTKAATCYAEGTRERQCDCGEKQTESIGKTSHNYVNGVCSVCKSSETANNPSGSSKETKYNKALGFIEK